MNILHILHLPPITGIKSIDDVCNYRFEMLMKEISEQGIKDFEIHLGKYDPKDTKKIIHEGHRNIVQQAKDKGDKYCIIAEDDIAFTHSNSWEYFLSQIPESYDIFSGLVYSATMEGNRIRNGGSGMTSLYIINSRFYDFFLSMDTTNHVDREIALTAYKHEYFVCPEYVVIQRGGYSIQKRQILYYDEFLRDKKMYNGLH